ncbi:hypothetical protein J4480_06040 [Candidatus Woesearchaeota archaeon]|nr:hypothetical protein [Candidatus Woesearchaeota archaeon]
MNIIGGRSVINLGYSPLSDIQLVRVGEESTLEYKYYIDPNLKIRLFNMPLPIKALPETPPLDEITLQLLPALKGNPFDYPVRENHRISDLVFESISMESGNGKQFMEMIGRHPKANLVALTHSLAWNPSVEGAIYLELRRKGFKPETPYLRLGREGSKQTYGIRVNR